MNKGEGIKGTTGRKGSGSGGGRGGDKNDPLVPLDDKANNGGSDYKEILNYSPYVTSLPWLLMKWLLVLLTGGLFGLCLLWRPKTNFWFERRCTPVEADKFFIRTNIDCEVSYVSCVNKIKYFDFRGIRYVLDNDEYLPVVSYIKWWTHDKVLNATGLEDDVGDQMRVNEAENIISVPVPSLGRFILDELFQPDYIYIYLCCVLWFFHTYAVYSAIILVSCVISGLWEAYTQRNIRLHIRKMAKYSIDVSVFRSGRWVSMSSKMLIAGDIIEIPQGGFKAPCDMAIIQGSAIVDESSLTGESLPVVKLKIDDNPHLVYNPEKYKKGTIFSGTTVLAALPGSFHEDRFSDKVVGVVARTGWNTSKGQLIRSILNVAPVEYQYDREARMLLGILIGVGVVFFLVSLYLWDGFISVTGTDVMYGFETITMIVPPLLPALFHIGVLMSSQNLQKDYRVFTTDPSRIPLAAKIHVMCFDKTGTLTKDDLDMIGVIPCRAVRGGEGGGKFGGDEVVQNATGIPEELISAMVTCHSLSEYDARISDLGFTGLKYSGNTVDVKVFSFTGWDYHDPSSSSSFPYVVSPDRTKRYEILKRFEFDPVLQRMSVIFRDMNTKQLFVSCKGSPEVIGSCCKSNTIPPSYLHEVHKHSRNGCYVLAASLSCRDDLDLSNLNALRRDDVECNLDFVGLLLLRNELKPDTPPAITQLHQGCIRTVIVTGDNIFTGFYISMKSNFVPNNNECFFGDVVEETDETTTTFPEIVEGTKVVFRNVQNPDVTLDLKQWQIVARNKNTSEETRRGIRKEDVSLGITSAAWVQMRDAGMYHDFLMKRITLFARMKPIQKGEVILMFKEKYIVGMCGDGANDCAALNLAHCGIALSEAEASVVSPFTAQRKNIPSVVHLMREARACLANSFAMFKLTLVSGIFEMTQALLAYTYGTDMSEWQYVIIDFFMFIPFAFYTVKSLPHQQLINDPPSTKVFGLRTLSSMLGVLIISEFMIAMGIALLEVQWWYSPSQDVDRKIDPFAIPETTSTWFIGNFAYSAIAVSFAFGSNHRRPFWLNLGLVVSVWFVLGLTSVFIWCYPEWDFGNIYSFMSFVHLPFESRLWIFLVGWVGFFLILLYERFLVHGPLANYLKLRFNRTRTIREGFSHENTPNTSASVRACPLFCGEIEKQEDDYVSL